MGALLLSVMLVQIKELISKRVSSRQALEQWIGNETTMKGGRDEVLRWLREERQSEKFRVMKENGILTHIATFKIYDRRQLKSFHESSLEIMRLMDPSFEVQSTPEVETLDDCLQTFRSFLIFRKMKAKAMELEGLTGESRSQLNSSLVILIKWLIELSRCTFNQALRDAHIMVDTRSPVMGTRRNSEARIVNTSISTIAKNELNKNKDQLRLLLPGYSSIGLFLQPQSSI
eukprot:TRINITY_DN4222_c0_g1_i1.p1 TRINITY_DN4222_c0_g1~~TRINITY_DN4222_c0_g1_i1.p1  ORF type:complete len:231 (-),score=26.86 TRINITY_DN4222_c0_g1_i1:55-747(-)